MRKKRARLVRERSLAESARLGYDVMPGLPLPDAGGRARTADEVADRCLVLHVLIAVSYGFPRRRARDWLAGELLTDRLSDDERRYLAAGEPARDHELNGRSECVWVLVWALGIAGPLDFGVLCPDDLVHRLPDLKAGESAAGFRARARLLPAAEVLAAADLAYCLHWAVVDSVLRGQEPPGRLAPWAVVERRRALEWLVSGADWDEVSLDT